MSVNKTTVFLACEIAPPLLQLQFYVWKLCKDIYSWGFSNLLLSGHAHRICASLDNGSEPRPSAGRVQRAGCEKIFEEKKSGKVGTKRPALKAALAYLRPEDFRVVWKLDRLGRSLVEMMRAIDELRQDGVKFQSLTKQFDSETARGRKGGRPTKLLDEDIEAAPSQ